ncbi:GRAM domain-containing protein 2A isoform X4 [Pangasianodon hypophthalmus]|uniref:GRAM domain-containing protein 2A isoform X3 n=1 Tax=Pangasianodon hypophthalmus TaxID=310915 RepID=UPI001479CA86|nr:GRAM domain-containing protein 2A isoform X3 [Pangasianodon hypophthalmus]XP_034164758.1 GRAM domain-containing protein 2A isoform X4 [Pangasianodon hypophthalmus]
MLDCCLLCSSVLSLWGELSSESKTGRGLSLHAAMTQCYFNEGAQLEPGREKKVEDMLLIANKSRTMSDQTEDVSLLTPQDASEPPKEEDTHNTPNFRVHLFDELSCEDVKKCTRGSTVSKYNSQYHKLFHNIPMEENLMKVYSCALLRDILLQGRLYISRNWLCFYANLFGKDIKVCIPVLSVRLVKKHKTAGLVPNGLAITTDSSQKYVFVSLLSRDSVYDVLRQICTHLQVNGKKSLSFKQYMEEPTSLSLDEFSVPDEYPVAVDEFTPVLKWRRKPTVASVSSSLPDLLGNSTSSLSAVDTSFQPSETLQETTLESEKILLTEPVPELGQMEYQLLKFFILLIILLILSSCYLAFRVCSLEQQLSLLSSKAALPLQER